MFEVLAPLVVVAVVRLVVVICNATNNVCVHADVTAHLSAIMASLFIM